MKKKILINLDNVKRPSLKEIMEAQTKTIIRFLTDSKFRSGFKILKPRSKP